MKAPRAWWWATGLAAASYVWQGLGVLRWPLLAAALYAGLVLWPFALLALGLYGAWRVGAWAGRRWPRKTEGRNRA